MSPNQILYIIAYSIFLIGAARSFRTNGSRGAVLIMVGGVIVDFLASILPMLGVRALSSGTEGLNGVMMFAIILGFLVWLFFLIALFVWKQGRLPLFHLLVTAVEVVWFVDFVSFLYGMYRVPLP